MKKKIYKQTPTGWTNTLQQDISEVIKDRLKEGYKCTKELSTGNWICIK